jgi:hypothetical protein
MSRIVANYVFGLLLLGFIAALMFAGVVKSEVGLPLLAFGAGTMMGKE